MSFHRAVLVACTAVFAAILSSAAFAQCGGCAVPMTYVQPVVVQPVVVQPVVEMQPVVVQPVIPAVPVAPAPIAVDHWDTNGWCGCCGGCGCGGCGATAVIASPLYVVNQGPEYSGPGLMVPFGTYSPATNVAAPGQYPYVMGPGYGYGPRYPYFRSRFAYRRHYWHPYRYYPHYWRG